MCSFQVRVDRMFDGSHRPVIRPLPTACPCRGPIRPFRGEDDAYRNRGEQRRPLMFLGATVLVLQRKVTRRHLSNVWPYCGRLA